MNISQIAQLVGAIALLVFFAIDFVIVIIPRLFDKFGRTASLWLLIYIFIILMVRVLSLIGAATLDQLRVISGFSALIPLVAVVVNLIFVKYTEKDAIIEE